MAIEITEEIEFAAWQAYTDKAEREYDVDQEALRAALAAVAPLIEAQVQARAAVKKHTFWMPGDPDCPPELKASNGELHTLRCKVCGGSSLTEFCND